jgi:hypothetical protein
MCSCTSSEQTVILDTCHAGSATRDPEGIRSFDLSKDYTLDISELEANAPKQDRAMAAGITGWGSGDSTSHVLLAATSAEHPAREEEGQGVFTRALLKFLRARQDTDMLTYKDIIRDLPPLKYVFMLF